MMPDSDMALYAALDNEDPTEESFEQLFEKMRLMKGKDYICNKTVPARLERNNFQNERYLPVSRRRSLKLYQNIDQG